MRPDGYGEEIVWHFHRVMGAHFYGGSVSGMVFGNEWMKEMGLKMAKGRLDPLVSLNQAMAGFCYVVDDFVVSI